MGRPSKIRRLDVWMNGELTGNWTLTSSGEHIFTYDPAWLDSKFARPISISMPLRPPDAPYRGPGVEAFFDNLIPDSPEIRRRFQSRFGTPTPKAFDLLAELGRDCVGALQLAPAGKHPGKTEVIHADPLKDADVAAALRATLSAPLPGQTSPDDFRISLAGSQEKTAFLKLKGKWHRPKGATATSHIFKLPMSARVGKEQLDLSTSVENEWLCSRIVGAFGIPVAACEAAVFEDQRVLIVERFDRRWSPDKSWLMRLPQEDICQAMGVPLGRKYEAGGAPGIPEILRFLLGSRRSLADRRLFLKSQVLFWMLCAVDGHARNFSIFIGRGGAYGLTPLYDVLSAYPILGHGKNRLAPEKAKMAMAVKGRGKHYLWERMTREHWKETARIGGLETEMEGILSELIEGAVQAEAAATSALPPDFPASVADPILSGLKKAALRLGRKG
ncbi:MAG TPA: type II toxin-antitoxin system HipA family toxin [Fibrobacteria bacterium]|nr:type II toxin-antitoxin system HipA family toxin [Fibrobacteria bacterium]